MWPLDFIEAAAFLSAFWFGVLAGWLLRGLTVARVKVTLAADIREKKSQLALLTLRELVDTITVIPWQHKPEEVEESVARAAKIIDRLRMLQEENGQGKQ